MTPIVLFLFIPPLLLLALVPYTWRHRTTPGAKSFLMLVFAVIAWGICYALQLGTVPDLAIKSFWSAIKYVGITITPVVWFVFALEYTGHGEWLTRRKFAALFIMPAITMVMAFVNPSNLMWPPLQLITTDQFVTADSLSGEWGPWFLVHAAYSYLFILLGIALLVRSLRRFPQMYQQQAGALVVAVVLPLIANAIFISGLSPIPYLDLTSAAFAFSALLFAWALFRYRLLDIAPVAHDAVFKSMADIAIVVDQNNRIVDINPAGQQVIGRTATALIGQPIESALADWSELVTRYRGKLEVQEEILLANIGGAGQRNYDLRITPISDRRGQVTGRLVVLRDITEGRLVQALSDSEQHLRQRAEQLQAMAEVTHAITAIQELDQLLPAVPQLISNRFGFYHVGIFLLADDGQSAVLTAANSEVGQRLVAQNYRLEAAQTNMVCDVIRSGKTQAVTDASRQTSFLHHADLPLTQSEITLPLKAREQVIGALDLQSTLATTFADEDLAVLGTLANQVAIVIENARLFAQQTQLAEENKQLLQRAETAIGDLDDLTHRLTGERWEKYLADQRNELVFEDVRPGSPIGRSELPEIDQAVEKRELVVSADSGRQALALPITLRGQVIGAIGLEEDQPGQGWAEDGAALMREVAEHVSLALDNAQLFEEARIRAEELTVLNELGQALNARLDVDQVLAQVYTGLSRLIDTTNFYIALYDPEKHTVSFPVNVTESVIDQQITTISADQGLTGYILRTRTSLLIKDSVSQWQKQMGMESLGQSAQSWLGVPMMTGGQIIGVMAVQNYETPNVFDEHDRDLLAAFANQTANAIQNARLFEQTEAARAGAEARLREAQILQQLSQTVSKTLDVDQVLDALMQTLEQQMGFTFIAIALIDREAGLLRTVRAAGAAAMQGMARPLEAIKNDITMDIASKGQIEVIDGWDDRFDRAIYEREGHAGLVRAFVPLMLRGQSIGIIEAGYLREKRARITPEEVRVLGGMADQVAVTIDNARLFEQTQHDAERERIISHIAGQIRNAQSVEQVLRIATQELRLTTMASRSVAEIAPRSSNQKPNGNEHGSQPDQ